MTAQSLITGTVNSHLPFYVHLRVNYAKILQNVLQYYYASYKGKSWVQHSTPYSSLQSCNKKYVLLYISHTVVLKSYKEILLHGIHTEKYHYTETVQRNSNKRWYRQLY